MAEPTDPGALRIPTGVTAIWAGEDESTIGERYNKHGGINPDTHG